MSIRLACPNCRAELTYPGTAAGTRSNCPRCQSAFRVPLLPIASIIDDKTPRPDLDFDRHQTPMPDTIARERPRPIYKQTPQKEPEPPPEKSSRSGERGRIRKKVRVRKGKPLNPVVLIAAGVGALLILIIIVTLIWKMYSSDKEESKPVEMLISPPGEKKQDIVPKTSSTMGLPSSWSLNEKIHGFVTAWPLPGGPLGFTVIEKLSCTGEPTHTWSYTNKKTKFEWTIEKKVISNIYTNDEDGVDKALNEAVEQLKLEGLTNLETDKRRLNDKWTVYVSCIKEKIRTTIRLTIYQGHLWIATVTCPEDILYDDNRIFYFLNRFEPVASSKQ